MKFEKQLFYLKNDNIEIDIKLGFEDDSLRLVGYDIGKTVEEAWGDSDYEYEITVKGDGLIRLYEINEINYGQREKLVDKLSESFSDNRAYSMFMKYLDRNRVKYESFTWA